MSNDLKRGVPRVGNLSGFNVQVALQLGDTGIEVTVPWPDPESPYMRWFTDAAGIRVGAAREISQSMPRRVLFSDSYGSVLLIYCRPVAYHRNIVGPGTGTLRARAAIMSVGEDLEFDRPHGIETEISGLRAWLGMTSWSRAYGVKDDPTGIALTSQSPPAVDIGTYTRVQISFRPNWRITSDESGNQVLSDLLGVVTRSEEPLGWDAHLQLHRAVRDLLVISRWHAESCIEVKALRMDDLVVMDDAERGAEWRAVVVAEDQRAREPTHFLPHLICYDELGPEGVLRWIALRDGFARALDPVISSVGLRGTTAQTLLAHTGPGLEALGYLLMRRDGVGKAKAAGVSLGPRFDRILHDVGDSLPFDGPTWAKTTIEAYNGLKHANREEPDVIDVLNAWRQSVVVVRAWVAIELGVQMKDVKARLAEDPRRFPYFEVGAEAYDVATSDTEE